MDLNERQNRPRRTIAPDFTQLSQPDRRFRRVLTTVAVVAAVIILTVVAAAFFYYQSLKTTPQYSIALLVDAARRDDKAAIDQFVDINAVVDDFLPQITDKAIEMYGRGQPPDVIARATRIAQPIIPAVKDRARAELPRVIRSRTERFAHIPFFAMVMGADQYLDILILGDVATVKSKLADRQLEMTMRRNGDVWQIVGVRDEKLATDIARAIGQQIMTLATEGINRRSADRLGVGNVADLLRQAEELVR